MDLYQLKTFFTLAKVESYTKAAETLFLTQSAVSHAIKKLENSIDTKLIMKKGKEFKLTEAGKALFNSCKKIFFELDKVEEEISYFKKKLVWSVKIGAPVEFGTTILIKHVKDFMNSKPNIHLDFYFSHHLKDSLIKDKVDFIIDCYEHKMLDIKKFNLFVEQYITIASPKFIKKLKIVEVANLGNVNVLSIDKDLNWWNRFLTSVPQKNIPQFKKIIQINHIRGIINAAISGIGIGFVPKYTVLKELSEKLLIDPFPNIKPLADHFNIYIKNDKLKLKKNKLVINYLLKIKPFEFGNDSKKRNKK